MLTLAQPASASKYFWRQARPAEANDHQPGQRYHCERGQQLEVSRRRLALPILAAFAPTLPIALSLLLLRAALSQMDVPTRSSYVMAVVTEAERPAAASFTSAPRSLAAAASPALAGALFAASFQVLPLLICGGLKIVYDLLLLLQFRRVKPPKEQ